MNSILKLILLLTFSRVKINIFKNLLVFSLDFLCDTLYFHFNYNNVLMNSNQEERLYKI